MTAVDPAPTGRAERTTTRVYVLDGLRLAAALMVVAWHLVAGVSAQAWGVGSTYQIFPQLYWPARYGWLGVELFFLISGFVICMSSWGRTVGEFAISRVVRLYPAYWLAIIVTTAVLALYAPIWRPLSGVDTLVNLTMLEELAKVDYLDPAHWTLTVELLFYVLFAVVVYRGVTYRRVVAFCAIWTLLGLFGAAFGNAELHLFLGGRYSPYFIAGIAFYLMYRFGANLLLWGIVGFSLALALVRMKAEVGSYGATYRPAAAMVVLFFALMAAIALGAFERVRWRVLTTAGALTYPIYLLHQVLGLTVITALHRQVAPWILLVVVVLGLLVASWLVHRFVERPASRVLRAALTRCLNSVRASERTDRAISWARTLADPRPPRPPGPDRRPPGQPGPDHATTRPAAGAIAAENPQLTGLGALD